MQINITSIKYMLYKAKKKFFLSPYKSSYSFYRELYWNEFSQWLDDKICGKKGFKKLLNSTKYFMRQKKRLFATYKNPHTSELYCIFQSLVKAEKPIIEIQPISEFYFDERYAWHTDVLYCKDAKTVIFEFMKGTVMPEYFIDTPEDQKRLSEAGENYGDVWDEIINARIEKIKLEGKWDDAPCDRRYVCKWRKIDFFMPYAKKKNNRKSIVIRETGPIYPKDAVKLEDYYKIHTDSRPKLVW